MKTTEVNKELIGKRCECIFTGLMVTGVIEDTEENEHTIEVKVRFDRPHQWDDDLYNDVCDMLCNKELMDNLNELLKQRFLIVSSVSAFAQGLTNSFLDCLTERDGQTSKQIFQLILDDYIIT